MSFLSLKYDTRVGGCQCFVFAGFEVVYLPGQSLVLHGRDSVPIPRQSEPPPDGGGLLQERMRVCRPVPHDWLQLPQLPHCDQPPSIPVK